MNQIVCLRNSYPIIKCVLTFVFFRCQANNYFIMADDIDDLLNETEAAYLSSSSGQNIQQNDNVKHRKTSSSIINELDDLLDEMDDIKDENPNNKDACSKSQTFSQTLFHMKCFPVYLAGSYYPSGISSRSTKRSCNKLRCTSCDFKVLSFEDFVWHTSTDYLFLRNNVPDFGRLKTKLLFRKGWRAYCCQCYCKAVSCLTPLTQAEMKWVCGQH